MVLLVLNSMLWSAKAWTGSQYLVDSANEQINWLSSELKKAKNDGVRVIIQSHIPPGYVYILILFYHNNTYVQFN